MPTAFETFVNDELPNRVATQEASQTAGYFPRYTGTAKLTTQRSPAQILADISAAKITVGGGAPVGAGADGDLYWDSTNNILYAYDLSGTAWVEIGPGGVASSISIVDAGGYFTATEVEAALAELAAPFAGKWPQMTAKTTLTISGGVVTVTQDHHSITGQGDADDDLDTISGVPDNAFVWLRKTPGGHGTQRLTEAGNIVFVGPAPVLASVNDEILLWGNPNGSVQAFQPGAPPNAIQSNDGTTGIEAFDGGLLYARGGLSALEQDYAIASGRVSSVAGLVVRLQAESGTADNCASIHPATTGGGEANLMIVFAYPGDVITLKHLDTGEGEAGYRFVTPAGIDVALTGDDGDFAILLRDATLDSGSGAWSVRVASGVASSTSVADAGGYYVGTNVEAALAELGLVYALGLPTGGNGISVSGALVVALANLTANWTQAGVFDISHAGNLTVLKHAAFGSASVVSATKILSVSEIIANGNARGLQVDLSGSTASGAGTIAALNFTSRLTAASGNQAFLDGLFGSASYEGAANIIGAMHALRGALASTAAGVGTLAAAYGLFLDDASWVGSKPAVTYALYPGVQGHASIALTYGLNIPAQLGVDARSFLADGLAIGTDAALKTLLDVYGNIAVLSDNQMRFYDSDNSDYIALRANAARTTSIVYILPATDPTVGQVLSASAPSAGVVTLSWAAGGGGGTAYHEFVWFSPNGAVGDLQPYHSMQFTAAGTAVGLVARAKNYGDGTTTINVLKGTHALPNTVFTTMLTSDLQIISQTMGFGGMEDVVISGGALSVTALADGDTIRQDYDTTGEPVDMSVVLTVSIP